MYDDRKVPLPGQTQAELHILKVEKLDVCIRPLFANPVTYRPLINNIQNKGCAYSQGAKVQYVASQLST